MPEEPSNQEPQDVEPQDESIVYAFPAQIVQRVAQSAATDELLELAKQKAPDTGAFDERETFFFTAQISNGSVDAYFTRMLRSTLENFANDANEGRAFLEAHNTRTRPVGYSLRGRYVGGSAAGKARVEADFFIRPERSGVGRKVDLIDDIRDGTQRDVSVGFNLGDDGAYICDLCKRDYLGGECPHMLGTKWNWDTYKYSEEKICTAGIDNGHLNETSAVYDGATPGAAIIKAIRAMEEGRMTPEMARVLEPMYRVKLAGARHSWALSSYASTRTDTPGPAIVGFTNGIQIGGSTSSPSYNHTGVADGGVLTGTVTANAGPETFISKGANGTLSASATAGGNGTATTTDHRHPSTFTVHFTNEQFEEMRANGLLSDNVARYVSNREEGSMPDQDIRNPEAGQEPNPPPAVDPPAETRTDGAAAVTTTESRAPAYTAPRPEPAPEERAIETNPAEWTPEQYETVVRSVCAGAEVPVTHAAECVRRLVGHIADLEPLAESGRAYREALTREVLHECARALGKGYDEARYRALYANATTADLVRFHEDWKTAAEAVLPTGRRTSDTYEPEPVSAEPVRVPAAAYRG